MTGPLDRHYGSLIDQHYNSRCRWSVFSHVHIKNFHQFHPSILSNDSLPLRLEHFSCIVNLFLHHIAFSLIRANLISNMFASSWLLETSCCLNGPFKLLSSVNRFHSVVVRVICITVPMPSSFVTAAYYCLRLPAVSYCYQTNRSRVVVSGGRQSRSYFFL